MKTIKENLKEEFDVELEKGDKLTLNHCYSDYMIADIVVTEKNGEVTIFDAYNLRHGCFPY